MIFKWIFAGALGLAASVTAAWADGAAAPLTEPAPTCDFFQAQLIGVFCGHTAYVGAFGGGSDETVNQTRTVPPTRFFPRSGGTTYKHWDYQNAYEGVTLAVSPWQGVQFHVSGEAFQFDDSYSTHDTFFGFHHNVITPPDSGGIPGWAEIGGAATLWDRQLQTPFGAIHTVTNVIGNFAFTPGGGPYPGRDLQQLGWESGAELPLGGSGFALTYLSSNVFERLDNPGFFDIQNMTRVMLANDPYGWAVGPLLQGTTVLWHAPGVNTGWMETRLGGEALLEPFRRTSLPVLRDLTIDLAATHSLGQGALVPNWAGNASVVEYVASARFNFSF